MPFCPLHLFPLARHAEHLVPSPSPCKGKISHIHKVEVHRSLPQVRRRALHKSKDPVVPIHIVTKRRNAVLRFNGSGSHIQCTTHGLMTSIRLSTVRNSSYVREIPSRTNRNRILNLRRCLFRPVYKVIVRIEFRRRHWGVQRRQRYVSYLFKMALAQGELEILRVKRRPSVRH